MKKNYILSICIAILTLFCAVVSNAQIPTNGLVGYWPFNGNANDESGNLNNGTVFGASLTNDRFGIPNSAYHFDGDKNYIEIQPAPSINTALMNALSISVWFNLEGYNNYNRIVSFMNKTVNQNIELCITTNLQNPEPSDYNLVVFENFTGASDIPIVWGKQISLQKWYHVVGIMDYSNSTAYLYLDNEFLGSGTGTAVKPDNPFMDIGCLVNSIPTWLAFDGKIDDVRVYNRKLETYEISALYNEGKCFETVYDSVKVSVTDTLIITANLASGTNPPTDQNIIKAYPNPTNDHLLIDNGDFTKMTGYKIKIINSLGNQVFESVIDRQLFNIDLNTFGGKGLYYLQIIDNTSQIIEIKKIVLK